MKKINTFLSLAVMCLLLACGSDLYSAETNINKAPKVSIVIPVYNKAHYLKMSLDSAINQTLKDIEIVCVDDGSTDDSATIIQEYAKKDKRIRLIKLENNGGTLAARARAAYESRGEFILSLDPDDELYPEIAEKSYNKAKETGADIVHFKCLISAESNESNGEGHDPDTKWEVMNNEEIVSHLLQYQMSFDVWNKLVSRKLWTNILDEMGKDFYSTRIIHYEDIAASFSIYYNAKTYAPLDYVGYKYYRWPDSVCIESNFSIEKKIREIKNLLAVFKKCKSIVRQDQKKLVDRMLVARYSLIIPQRGMPEKDQAECILNLLNILEPSSAEEVYSSVVASSSDQLINAYDGIKLEANEQTISKAHNILLVAYGQSDEDIINITIQIHNKNPKCNIFVAKDCQHSVKDSDLSKNITVIDIAPNGIYRYKSLRHVVAFRKIDTAIVLPTQEYKLDIGDSFWLNFCKVPVLNCTNDMCFN